MYTTAITITPTNGSFPSVIIVPDADSATGQVKIVIDSVVDFDPNTQTEQEIADLQAQLTAAQNQLAADTNTVNSLTEQSTSATAQVTADQAAVTQLQSQIAALQATLPQ